MLKAIWTFITNGAGNRKVMGSLLLYVLSALSASYSVAQKITKIGEFTSYEDDVQFLPGAFVMVHHDIKDSKTKLYQYHLGRFVRVKANLPSSISRWDSFGWKNADLSNQLDLSFFADSISAFLPRYSKVKAYETISGIHHDKTIVALCYTMISDKVIVNDPAHEGGPKDLHLLMLSRNTGPTFTNTTYTKLADLLIADEVSFGTMLVEHQAGRTFIAIYFADGGSHQTNSVAIFQVRRARAKLAAAK